jgi:hypothetical protein
MDKKNVVTTRAIYLLEIKGLPRNVVTSPAIFVTLRRIFIDRRSLSVGSRTWQQSARYQGSSGSRANCWIQ